MADSFGLGNAPVVGADYAIDGESGGASYPWIQADNYRPSNAKSKIAIGITAESLALAGSEILSDAVNMESASYDDEGTEVEFGYFDIGVRWVILAKPRTLGMHKATGEIVPLAKGMKGRGEITVCRLLLGCIVGDELVMDDDGNPQIFTLKLKSSKTAFIGSDRDKDFGVSRNNNHRTIAQLNDALLKRANGKPGQWLGHTVSVELGAVAEKFSNADGESSLGIRFIFPEGSIARPLPKRVLDKVFKFITTDEFKTLARNPFARPQQQVEPTPTSLAVDEDFDEMPF